MTWSTNSICTMYNWLDF